jgi:starch phosphorylase
MTLVDPTRNLDPVCGMPAGEPPRATLLHGGRMFAFCSEFCQRQFERQPGAYDVAPPETRRNVQWWERRVAYFTMEVALTSRVPTYSGGLGVLAGDTLLSCADLEVPIVGVSLVHRKGYFRQQLEHGRQLEEDATWQPEDQLEPLEPRVSVELEGRQVQIRAWHYPILGSSGYPVPVLLLDTDVLENDPQDRVLTDRLYGGDDRYRLMQEVVLGVGGVRMLAALGCEGLRTYHLNEGHAALAPLELLRRESARHHHAEPGLERPESDWDFASVRRKTVFTTHTPVPAGHDRFDEPLVRRVLGDGIPAQVLQMLGGGERLNMTLLALNLSHYVNGVALRHREVSSLLFPEYEIHQVTNGVHSLTWTSHPFRVLFDRYIPGWRNDPLMLHNATALAPEEVWKAHQLAKNGLVEHVLSRSGRRLRNDVLTIGFARRATAYKRPELILSDLERLRRIAKVRPLQILFAGKAHPKDDPGRERIRAVFDAAERLGDDLPIVYLPDYDLELAYRLVAGVDLWLNTPLRPLEASGTSGMKAAHNGVPSLSVLDGWWKEGHIEGVTGWAIGGLSPEAGPDVDRSDAKDLYQKLEHVILPLFYEDRAEWVAIMRQCIALNASFFNTHRMVRQYLLHAYAAMGE